MTDEDKKRYHDLDFSDVTAYDVQMIKSIANQYYQQKSNQEANPNCIIEAVFHFINAKGMRISRDETREDTWTSKPKQSWSGQHKKTKADWQF